MTGSRKMKLAQSFLTPLPKTGFPKFKIRGNDTALLIRGNSKYYVVHFDTKFNLIIGTIITRSDKSLHS